MHRPKINNEIQAAELRLIDEEGKNLGVVKKDAALEMAKNKGLDLIEISPNAAPPIAKIMDFGKFLYKESKRAKEAGKKTVEIELKHIRIHLGTSEHDLDLKAKRVGEFLKEGHRIRIELFLKGREKYLDKNFLRERLERILKLIVEKYKVLQDIKFGPRGLITIIEKSK